MDASDPSSPGSYGIPNDQQGRRYSQLNPAQMQRFPTERSTQYYAGDVLDQPPRNRASSNGYEYHEMARVRSWYSNRALNPEAISPSLDTRNDVLSLPNPLSASNELETITDRFTNPPWTNIGGFYEAPVFQTQNQQRIVRQPQVPVHRKVVGSDVGTGYTHGHRDSAYCSYRGDDVQSLANLSDPLHINAPNQPPNYNTQLQSFSDTASSYAPPGADPHWDSQGTAGQLYCPVPDCKVKKSMNLSEYRKHEQRHEKPYKCLEQNCKGVSGFATKNDLSRHLKSVHKKYSANCNPRTFICKGQNCPHQYKQWPRLDNFKAHCSRLHPEEDIQDLIQRSEIEERRKQPLPASGEPADGQTPTSTAVLELSTPRESSATRALLDLCQSGPPLLAQRSPTPPLQRRGDDKARTAEDESMSDQATDQRERAAVKETDGNIIPDSDKTVSTDDIPSTRLPTEASLSTDGRPRNNGAVAISNAFDILRLASPTLGPMVSIQSGISSVQTRARLRDALVSGFNAAQSGRSPLTTSEMAEVALECITTLCKQVESEFSLDAASSLTRRLSSVANIELAVAASPVAHLKRSAVEAGANGSEPAGKNVKSRADASVRNKPIYICKWCGQQKKRRCDLNKHELRHERRWGCTNETCDKAFGSKNDWKRHENSQHERLQLWRCQEPSGTSRIGVCAKTFSRADEFRTHLVRDHKINNDTHLKEQSRKARVGKNWQDRFWCGFCRRIIKLHHKGLLAWDERFNHIDNDHFSRGERIESWYPMNGDMSKGELTKTRLSKRALDVEFEQGSEDTSNVSETDDDVPPPPPPPLPPPPSTLPPSPPPARPHGGDASPGPRHPSPSAEDRSPASSDRGTGSAGTSSAVTSEERGPATAPSPQRTSDSP